MRSAWNSKDALQYNLGIALSGGGARGFAHVGALKAVEELGLKPDLIAGVSAGSIVGALYADGYTPEEILELFAGFTFTDFAQIMLPRTGFFKMDEFRHFLKRHLRAKRIEELKIPLHVVATDIDCGESVSLCHGELIEALSASCSIPVLFPPVKIGGTNFVDGGVLRNFPVTPIRPICHHVIGVNVCPMLTTEYKENIVGIAERSYNLMFKSNTVADKELCDILIETEEVVQFNLFDLEHLKAIALCGYDDAKLALSHEGKQLLNM